MAVEAGVNYNTVKGSGPNGRIICRDIEEFLKGGMTASAAIEVPGVEFTEQPLSNVRKIIARAMHSSLQNSAQLTHHMSADVRRLLEARRKIKDAISKGSGQGYHPE